MSRLRTKQRRSALRRRGQNGDFKRRFLKCVELRVALAESRMNEIATRYFFEGIPADHLAKWLP